MNITKQELLEKIYDKAPEQPTEIPYTIDRFDINSLRITLIKGETSAKMIYRYILLNRIPTVKEFELTLEEFDNIVSRFHITSTK